MNTLSYTAIAGLGGMELAVIFVVILLIFGPKSLPSLGRSLGKGIREFKDASNKFTSALDDAVDEEERKEKDKTDSQRQISSPVVRQDLEVKDSVPTSSSPIEKT